jgi:hypothetical protein
MRMIILWWGQRRLMLRKMVVRLLSRLSLRFYKSY